MPPEITFTSWKSRISILLLIALSGCGGHDLTVRLENGAMEIPVPPRMRQIAGLGDDRLEIQIDVNGSLGRTISVSDSDEAISTVVNIPADKNNEITISWFAVVGSQNVLLADFTDVVIPGTTQLNVGRYNSTGSRFDADDDGRFNLQEALDNRSLLSRFDLEVPLLNSFGGTVAYIRDDGVADSEASGDPIEPDDDTLFRLRHTGSELIVYVCGQDRTLVRDNLGAGVNDNGEYWHDDTIFVYLDGADSDSGTYDQVDDFQFAFVRGGEQMIVSKGAGNSNCADGRCVQYVFFNNSSACEYELSVTLPLNDLNMAIDASIGFDIEIVDDDNGDQRDSSRAWIGYDDQSHLHPSTFGTIRLN